MSNKKNNKKNLSLNNILRGNVNVSVCTLNQWAMDFPNNEMRIIVAINKAKKEGGKIILLPELVTTGYSCQDHFYENETYMLSMNILRNICNHPGLTQDILLVLGAPVIHEGVKYNAMVFISNGVIQLIRPKINLADDGNYREARWFTSWAKEGLEKFQLKEFKQSNPPIGVAIVNCNGVKVAAEVCEELWIPQSMNIPLYLNDTDIILNSSGSHFEMNKIQKRINLVNAATKRSGGAYVYSNMKGCDGERLYFDGGSFIGVNGSIVGMQDRFSLIDIEVLTSTINLDDITDYRLRGASIQMQSSKVKKIDIIKVDLDLKLRNNFNSLINNSININKIIDHSKPINYGELAGSLFSKNRAIQHKQIDDISNKEIAEVCEASACWLWDYLKRSPAYGFMLPLSGGADSAAVSLLVKIMCDKIAESTNWDYIKNYNNNSRIVKRLILFNPSLNQPLTSKYVCSIILKSVFLPVKGRSFKEGNDPSSGETYKRSKAIADSIGAEWQATDITEIYKAAKTIGAKIMKEEIKKTINNAKRQNKNSGPTLGVKEIINPGLLTNNNKNSSAVKESKNKLRTELVSLRNLIIQNPTPSSNANLSLLNRVINVERFPRGLKETAVKNGKVENIDIAKAWSKFGLVDECVQARIRMVVNYILSASLNESSFLLTLACSNADEVLIGYYTKYDASSGDLNPIGSMPKRFVNKALEYYSLLWNSKAYADILIATPTAELSNAKEGARVQTDEDEIGLTYDQIYYFGKLRSQGYGMITMFDYIRKHMNNTDIKNLVIPGKKLNNNVNKINTIKYIAQKVKTFFSKYAINRHKTVILTPSVHLLPSPDDNRFDLRPFLYPAFVEQSKYIDDIISKLSVK